MGERCCCHIRLQRGGQPTHMVALLRATLWQKEFVRDKYHSSNDGSTSNLDDVNRILIPRQDLEGRAQKVPLYGFATEGIARYFDAVIYTDCDEIPVRISKGIPGPVRIHRKKRF